MVCGRTQVNPLKQPKRKPRKHRKMPTLQGKKPGDREVQGRKKGIARKKIEKIMESTISSTRRSTMSMMLRIEPIQQYKIMKQK